MIKIPVSASRNYDVIMQPGLLQDAGTRIREALGLTSDPKTGKISNKKICIVTDETVDALYGGSRHALWTSLEAAGFAVYKYVFPGGETHKTMATIAAILEYLAAEKFSRSDLLLALGGGITGDITGFAAASYLRGVEFIQVPTSLLATVDSSVGGKTGVNLSAGKNLAGAFWQPSLVMFDPDVLSTLSDELKLDGIAEAIKAGIIADPAILTKVQSCNDLNDPAFLTELAAMAVEVKRQVVEEDERESGRRQLLNLGHTVAHAIEKCSRYEISHGHAVAMGMTIISRAADSLGWGQEKCAEAILEILTKFRFPLACAYTAADLAEAATQDKKVRGGDITIVYPNRIGDCRLKKIPTSELEAMIAAGLDH